MRHKIVAGNWKMHGSVAENRALLDAIVPDLAVVRDVDCVVCAPFPYLAQIQARLEGSRVMWGAQNVNDNSHGAFTGEVSTRMLLEFGCKYVIVGHSERRTLFGETDSMVASKLVAALNASLIPIVCLGETLTEWEAGATEKVIDRQLSAILNAVQAEALSGVVIAYEPVWAIGTGKTASPEQAQAVHAAIRAQVARQDAAIARTLPILYGGSVKGSNARELFGMPDIDGGLVGGASLVAKDFVEICRAAQV